MSDEQAIRDLIATWMSATKAGDTATVLSLMADDALFTVPGKEPFGKQAFANTSKDLAGTTIDATHKIVELKILGNWAWMRCHLRVVMTPPAGPANIRSGYTLTILTKNASGTWQLARDANLLAPEKPKP